MKITKTKVLSAIVFTFALCIGLHFNTVEAKADAVVNAQQGVILKTTSISTEKIIKVPAKETQSVNQNLNNNEETISYSRGSSSYTGSSKLVSYAFKFLGCPYVWGASGPKVFDCSGFTSYVFRAFGVDLPHYSGDQARMGMAVARGDLQPGDLLYFNTCGSEISHVAIYIGNGQFIHASSGSHKVTVSDLSESYYTRTYRGARRFFY